MQQLILEIGNAIGWVIEPHCTEIYFTNYVYILALFISYLAVIGLRWTTPFYSSFETIVYYHFKFNFQLSVLSLFNFNISSIFFTSSYTHLQPNVVILLFSLISTFV
jgi:hypothetical protein